MHATDLIHVERLKIEIELETENTVVNRKCNKNINTKHNHKHKPQPQGEHEHKHVDIGVDMRVNYKVNRTKTTTKSQQKWDSHSLYIFFFMKREDKDSSPWIVMGRWPSSFFCRTTVPRIRSSGRVRRSDLLGPGGVRMRVASQGGGESFLPMPRRPPGVQRARLMHWCCRLSQINDLAYLCRTCPDAVQGPWRSVRSPGVTEFSLGRQIDTAR